MRRSSLFLSAAAMAAALPFTVNAAQAGGCDNPDELPVVTGVQSYEDSVGGGAVPLVTYGGHDVLVDWAGTASANIDVTISWDYDSDWDLSLYVDGEQVGESSIGDQLGGDPATENVVAKVDTCSVVEIRVSNYLADSTRTVDLVAKKG